MSTKILGISGLYHDSSAALCIDGEIISAVQEERFTRVKHDVSFPINAIDYCLTHAGILPDFLDAVVYYDNPFLTLDRWLHNITIIGDNCSEIIERDFNSLFSEKLWINKITENNLGMFCKTGKLLVTKHHIAHASSAFYPSPFERAAIIIADGVGEWATTSIGIGDGNDIKLLKHINYPHSLGLLYSAMTYFCGFKVNFGEYKLMGLAPYGVPRYADIIRNNLIDIKEDGSYQLNMDYFGYYSSKFMTNQKFNDLFGGVPRKPESDITKREMDIAASIQKVTEEVILLLARHVREQINSENLVMAGGVALNCVSTGKLIREKIFKHIWVQPAAGDAGGALGAALYIHYSYFNRKRKCGGRDSQKGSFLGPKFETENIKKYLNSKNAKYIEFTNKRELYKKLSRLLAGGNIVGFFNGCMEFGPRALGGRSILADPRNAEMQSKLNLKIKFRESFRPFAPAVLAEKVSEYFEFEGESPYMLICANVRKEHRKNFDISKYQNQRENKIDMLSIVIKSRSDIPAVTHVDYSARLQTVNALDNPDFHSLITEFYKLTGCPILVNTSFNVRGEPIVCTPEDAFRCFMRTDMDVLILENLLLYKTEQPIFKDEENWRNKYELD
ncbi:MAG: carbamoyltransferase [Endomicrobium sp.]|jgi:carbamoyltransferase|nr:carbamoyltransferase [Endomicrobium sp.]